MRNPVVLLVLCAACAAPEDTERTVPADSAVAVAETPAPPGLPSNLQPLPPSPAAAPGTRPTVLIIGTSLTAGYGLDDAEDAYPSVMQRMADSAGFNVRIANAGLSGETSAGAVRRLDWILREPASFVIVETGANDGLRGLDVDTTRANLRAIVKRIKAAQPQAKIAIVQMEAPPNLGPTYTQRFRESFALVAQEERVLLFPFLLDGVAGVRSLNQGDGIHPNVEGAQRVAANVWAALSRELVRP
jgi:acyl-CoA thioesterase I